ncbi:MAG: hypothetical protein KF862_19730, partial [Chitinophagaceae bacterium]|nr:hypothetical protein [Chitinophagaceae bacterium]
MELLSALPVRSIPPGKRQLQNKTLLPVISIPPAGCIDLNAIAAGEKPACGRQVCQATVQMLSNSTEAQRISLPTFGWDANDVFGFAISIKKRYPVTQPLVVFARPPASKFKLEQCYGGRSNPRAYTAFKLRTRRDIPYIQSNKRAG